MSKKLETNLIEYLQNLSLSDSVTISENPLVSFHWSNHRKSKELIAKTHELSNMHDISGSIWYEVNEAFIELKLIDLYRYAIQSINKKDNEDFWYNKRAISFDSPVGPFEELCLAEIIDSSVLKSFSWYLLSKNKIPQRSFRLDVDADILITYGENFLKDTKIKLYQVTQYGLAFRFCDDELIQELDSTKEVKIYINSHALKFGDSLYTEEEEYSGVIAKENLTSSLSLLSALQNENFLYIKYKDISNETMVNAFKDYVRAVEEALNKISA